LKIFDKVLLAFYSLGVMAALFLIGLVAAGWTAPAQIFRIYMAHLNGRTVVGVIVLIYLATSVRFFLMSLSVERRPAQALVHETGMGQVRVSVEAIENMVRRAAGQIKGVRDIRPRVVCLPEGINIFIRVVLAPETNIPEATDQLQRSVADYVSEIAGVNVQTVKILVDSISSETAPGATRKLN